MLTPHHLHVLWSWKGRSIPLLPLWTIQPVQSLSACTRVHFTFTFCEQEILGLISFVTPQKEIQIPLICILYFVTYSTLYSHSDVWIHLNVYICLCVCIRFFQECLVHTQTMSEIHCTFYSHSLSWRFSCTGCLGSCYGSCLRVIYVTSGTFLKPQQVLSLKVIIYIQNNCIVIIDMLKSFIKGVSDCQLNRSNKTTYLQLRFH